MLRQTWRRILSELFSRKIRYKYKEGKDFELYADVQRAKENDPYPWNIKFLGRVVKVNYVRLAPPIVEISIEYIHGEEFTPEEHQQFGDLIMEITSQGIHD